MKKSISALLTIAISVLCVAAAAAPVGASAGADAATVPPGALTLRPVDGSPGSPGFRVTIDPGKGANRRVVVSNQTTNLRLTVRLAAIAPNAIQASWVTLSDVVETLEPGAHVLVSARLLVPANVVPGAVNLKLNARVEHAARVVDGSPVAGTPSVSLPFAIKVQGAPTAQVSIVSVQNVSEQGRDYLAIEFQNVGATAMGMHGHIRVATTPPKIYPVTVRVAPLTNTVVRVAWVKPPGSKGVPVAVDTDNARGDQASWNGSVGAAPPTTVASRNVHTAAAPASAPVEKRDPIVLGVLAAVALAVLWFLYETVRAMVRRRRRRRRLREVGLIVPRNDPLPANTPVPVAAPVAANADQISAVAAQLGALVGAIEHLTARLDAVRPLPLPAPEQPGVDQPAVEQPARGTPIPAPPPPPSGMPARTPAPEPAPEPVRAPEPVPDPLADAIRAFAGPAAEPQSSPLQSSPVRSSLGDGYPYDWPTPEQLDRFVARRAAASDTD